MSTKNAVFSMKFWKLGVAGASVYNHRASQPGSFPKFVARWQCATPLPFRVIDLDSLRGPRAVLERQGPARVADGQHLHFLLCVRDQTATCGYDLGGKLGD